MYNFVWADIGFCGKTAADFQKGGWTTDVQPPVLMLFF
jgi:hypothetical protein